MDPSLSPSLASLPWEEQRAQILSLIAAEDYASLLALDELRHSLALEQVLVGFQDALTPAFPPSFKVLRGSEGGKEGGEEGGKEGGGHVPERRPSFTDWFLARPASGVKEGVKEGGGYHPARLPSYTDRVLTRSLPGLKEDLTCVLYESCPLFMSSDHKPVRACFEITPTVDPSLPPSLIGSHRSPGLEKGGSGESSSHTPPSLPPSLPSSRNGLFSPPPSLFPSLHLHPFSPSPFLPHFLPHCFPRLLFFDLRGIDLPVMDVEGAGGSTDAYLVFTPLPPSLPLLNKHPVRTKVVPKSLNPVWIVKEGGKEGGGRKGGKKWRTRRRKSEEVSLLLDMPLGDRGREGGREDEGEEERWKAVHICITAMDRDLASSDDLIGFAVLPIIDVYRLTVLSPSLPPSRPPSYAFNLPLMKNGTGGRGRIQGRVRLGWPERGRSFPDTSRREGLKGCSVM